MSGFTDMSKIEDLNWLSIEEARRIIGISARTLYRLIDDGSVPAYRFGRVIRLQQREVLAFIQAARVQPGSIANLYPVSEASKRSSKGRAS